MPMLLRNTGRTHFKPGHTPWNRGLAWSDALKAKMSAACMGRVPWNKGRKTGQVPWNKGTKGLCCANRGTFKVGEVHHAMPHKPETIRKLQRPRPHWRGAAHHNWQGGITEKSKDRRTGRFEYKEWRRQVFARDGYACVVCCATRCYLEADHIKPWAKHPEVRFVVSNGQTLCKPCHKKKTYGRIAV